VLVVLENRLEPPGPFPAGAKRHPRIIKESRLAQHDVAAFRQLNHHRRTHVRVPGHLRDRESLVDAFVIPRIRLEPNRACLRKFKSGVLPGHAMRPLPVDDITESDPVVENTHLQNVLRTALRMQDRDSGPAEVVPGLGVYAPGAIGLVHRPAIGAAHRDAPAEMRSIHGHTQRRRLDHRPALPRQRVRQLSHVTGPHCCEELSVGALHDDAAGAQDHL